MLRLYSDDHAACADDETECGSDPEDVRLDLAATDEFSLDCESVPHTVRKRLRPSRLQQPLREAS